MLKRIRQEQLKQERICFSLDTLNTTQRLELIGDGESFEVYISVYTNEHSKVIEFSFSPSKNIFETKREKDLKTHALEECKDSEDTFVIEPVQEGPRDPFKDPSTPSNTMQLSLKSMHISFIK